MFVISIELNLHHLDILVQVGQIVAQGEDDGQQHLPGVPQFYHWPK